MCCSVTSIGTRKTGLLPPPPIADHPTAKSGTTISTLNHALPQSWHTRFRTVWVALRLLTDGVRVFVLWHRLHCIGMMRRCAPG